MDDLIDPKINLFYESPTIKTKLNKNVKLLYADATGTGKPSPIIDNYVATNILPYYANTHSNSFIGEEMNNLIKNTRKYIHKIFNLRKDHCILFTGNGATGAINHLINSIDFSKFKKVNIMISLYEHNSNYVPWVELMHKNKKINLWILKNNNYNIDINNLDKTLKEFNKIKNSLNIVSITACSNVTGIFTNIKTIASVVNKYKKNNKNNYIFVDYACSAPYVNINGSFLDAFYISGHKFLGGYSTPGILIASTNLFNKTNPFIMGGGCVDYANFNVIKYSNNIEEKESAGTPNIIGIIKFKKVLELKTELLPIILHNEKIISSYVFDKCNFLTNKYKNFKIIFPDIKIQRLPIIAFSITGLTFDNITMLLSDLFGIQARGGTTCCGLLSDHIYKSIGMYGWCRITFSWYMNKNEIIYILDAIEFIIKNGINIINH